MQNCDVLIHGGKIIDGTGKPGYLADIAISDGKIVKLGACSSLTAIREIDASGYIVSPGFIDGHAHNDGFLFLDNSAFYKLMQGVTSEISGNCGEGLVPVNPRYQKEINEYYTSYNPPENFSKFTSHEYFFKCIENLKLGINVGFYCAHGTLRMAAMGFAERNADKNDLDKMKEYLREGMENGALGLSTGLIYAPGCFSDTEEIIELCKVVSEYNGVYVTHLRNEGMHLVESVKEAIEIGRTSGVSVIISHHKAVGKPNWGKVKDTLKLISQANAEGLNVSLDQYPYTSSCSVLLAALPEKYTAGGIGKLVDRLKDSSVREGIRSECFHPKEEWDNFIANVGFDGILILTAQNVSGVEGKTISQIAKETSKDPLDVLFDIIIESEGNSLAAYSSMCEDDLLEVMKYPDTMIISDGVPVKVEEKTHPRLCGTFPRVLGRYVREKQILTLEEAVRRMTSLSSGKIGLHNKGCIKEGYDADITIFDEETILDQATYENFFQKPNGIKYVLVNGKIAMENGEYTGSGSGKLIRRNKKEN